MDDENPYRSPQPIPPENWRPPGPRPLWVTLGLWPDKLRRPGVISIVVLYGTLAIVLATLAVFVHPLLWLLFVVYWLPALAWTGLAIRWVDKYDEWAD